jgi:hypothetical protein
MTDNDKPRFAAALAELSLLKHGAGLSTLAYDAWWNSMRDKWTLEAFLQACARLRDNVEYMPNPFHFEQLRKGALETHGEAWARALAHARSLPVSGGYLQEKPTGDVELDAAVRCVGGYKAIAAAGERDLQFMAQRFKEHHETVRDALDIREQFPSLPGPRALPPGEGPRRLLGA